jgi:hypothetical protein
MNQLKQLNMGHLVLNPHPNDLNKFSEFIPLITEWIQSKRSIKFFSISVEYGSDNKLSGKHLDIILFSSSDLSSNVINNKGKQVNLRGFIQQHKDQYLPNTQMLGKYGKPYYSYNNVKKGTEEYEIGYNMKEIKDDNMIATENWNNYPDDLDIDECLKIYHQQKSEDIKVKLDNYLDIIPLTPKNAIQLLLNFIEDNDIKDLDRDLQLESIRNGYSWIGLGKSQILRIFREIKIMRHEETQFDIDKIMNDQNYLESDPEKQLNFILSMGNKHKYEKYITLYDNKLLTDKEIQKLTDMDITELKQIFMTSQ